CMCELLESYAAYKEQHYTPRLNETLASTELDFWGWKELALVLLKLAGANLTEIDVGLLACFDLCSCLRLYAAL
ncbi:hypothetical protein M8C21_033069, partial [Ambrosia artemisiifolia]